ncbi:MAG TPA: CU044_5270 family protein [Solirubrobacterales bacterium]
MDHETLIRSFRAERADRDPRARDAAWEELELKLEGASPPMPSAPRRSHRRPLLAVTSVGALAAIVVVVLLSSGPSAEPAVAEVLHQTAAVAASGESAPTLQAGPGQYYFTKMKELEFKGWYPGSYEIPEGRATRPGGFSALIPSVSEWWISPEGGNRTRQRIGAPRFLSRTELSRWEEAGSPLPSAFEPARQAELQRLSSGSGERFLEMRRGVLDVERPRPKNGTTNPELVYPDLSGVPTDPEELRLVIQNHEAPGVSDEPGKPLGTQETIEDLGGLLSHPNASPALRAAAFNALAELPGVGLKRDATDLVGRTGYAISYSYGRGFRVELIFDPKTSISLGERVVLADPGQDPVEWKGYEAGLTLRDVAYLRSKVVDSTHEPALSHRK